MFTMRTVGLLLQSRSHAFLYSRDLCRCCMPGLNSADSLNGLPHLKTGIQITQVRWKRLKIKKRISLAPHWQIEKSRKQYPENLTKENQEYLKNNLIHNQGLPPTEIGSDCKPASSLLKQEAWSPGEWIPHTYRCGLIARKIGIYPLWNNEGKQFLCTLLQVVDNHVIKYYSPDEYQNKLSTGVLNHFKNTQRNIPACVVVGAESADPQLFTKGYCSLFSESGLLPKRHLTRFFISPNAALPAGTPLYAKHFQVGQYVDLYGKTIDRGHQGVMKRWGFKGMPATHGVTKSHRRGGNIGGGSGKARVFPGTKMPGRMGGTRRILRGLQILRINNKYNVIWVRGPAVPGETNSYVYIYDSRLKNRRLNETPAHFPTYFPGDDCAEDEYDESMFNFSEPSLTYEEKEIDKDRYRIPNARWMYKKYP